jgi:hypothetical protein
MLGTAGTASRYHAAADEQLDREVELLSRALEEHGVAGQDELVRMVGGDRWGPGRFRAALLVAVEEGRVRRRPHGEVAPPNGDVAFSGRR